MRLIDLGYPFSSFFTFHKNEKHPQILNKGLIATTYFTIHSVRILRNLCHQFIILYFSQRVQYF